MRAAPRAEGMASTNQSALGQRAPVCYCGTVRVRVGGGGGTFSSFFSVFLFFYRSCLVLISLVFTSDPVGLYPLRRFHHVGFSVIS